MNTVVRPRLRSWRRGFALKQKELASLLGLKCPNHVSRLENGHRAPSLEIAMAIELLTGEQVCFLFPRQYREVALKTLVRAQRLLDRICNSESPSAMRKRDLLIDVLRRLAEHNFQTPHVEQK